MFKEEEKTQLLAYLKVIQDRIYQNKLEKGFDLNVYRQFCYAYGEMAEALEACDRKQDNIGEELSDVVIYMFGLAATCGIDLGQELLKKIERNAAREYADKGGVMVRTKDA